MPNLFTWTGGSFQGNTVEILYDAAGTKLKKTVKTGATVNYTQEYIGGIEYRDGVREAIYHAEGRLYNNGGTNRYEYNIKDHLGNTRLSFTDKDGDGVVEVFNTTANEVLQENHYYPFGLNMDGKWMNDAALDNKYQYNGKEINDDYGLNWYNYGKRWYDAAVGRFPTVDPIAGKFAFATPYNYAENKVPNAIDLYGLQAVVVRQLYGRNSSGAMFLISSHSGTSENTGDLESKRIYDAYANRAKFGSRGTLFVAEFIDDRIILANHKLTTWEKMLNWSEGKSKGGVMYFMEDGQGLETKTSWNAEIGPNIDLILAAFDITKNACDAVPIKTDEELVDALVELMDYLWGAYEIGAVLQNVYHGEDDGVKMDKTIYTGDSMVCPTCKHKETPGHIILNTPQGTYERMRDSMDADKSNKKKKE